MLFQIVCKVCQRKNFDNRSIIGEDIATFFGPPRIQSLQLLLHLQLQLKIMGSWPWLFGVTWRHRSRGHDSRWSTSYGWSIVTMRLSCTVIEIWRLKLHVHRTTDAHNYGPTDWTTNLLISSIVHYVHLVKII